MFFVGLSPFYSRQKLERELLTWSFQNARGTVSLNLFKYQTLLFTSRANAKNIFDLAGIMSFSFVQDFIFNFYIFFGWGGGLFSSCQHLRIAIALYMYRYFHYLCTTYLFCISRWPTIFKPVLHLPYLLNIV